MRKDFYQCSYGIFFICIGTEQLATRAIFYPAHMPAGQMVYNNPGNGQSFSPGLADGRFCLPTLEAALV
ncbi:hypothetical protein ABIE50_005119 [Chitinophaga sp. OAE865]